jgi:D-sedoheptulose 7-phosphate isomerase
LVTCIANDFGFESLFERQVQAFAKKGDVAIGLTTSGRSQNVLRGLATARNDGAVTIAMTGESGLTGVLVDFTIASPSSDTAFIQEVHLMVIHAWCWMVEAAFG